MLSGSTNWARLLNRGARAEERYLVLLQVLPLHRAAEEQAVGRGSDRLTGRMRLKRASQLLARGVIRRIRCKNGSGSLEEKMERGDKLPASGLLEEKRKTKATTSSSRRKR